MRNPERIHIFVKELEDSWRIFFPDWRFGQLMCNLFKEYGDPFYWEEDIFLSNLKEFCEKYGKKYEA